MLIVSTILLKRKEIIYINDLYNLQAILSIINFNFKVYGIAGRFSNTFYFNGGI